MSETKAAPIKISAGWLEGSLVRLAREPCECRYWRGLKNGGFCHKQIPAGEFYAEQIGFGQPGQYGVILQDRYCLDCAGPEARAALSRATSGE